MKTVSENRYRDERGRESVGRLVRQFSMLKSAKSGFGCGMKGSLRAAVGVRITFNRRRDFRLGLMAQIGAFKCLGIHGGGIHNKALKRLWGQPAVA